jgi:hypothetical protein
MTMYNREQHGTEQPALMGFKNLVKRETCGCLKIHPRTKQKTCRYGVGYLELATGIKTSGMLKTSHFYACFAAAVEV